jgi:vancomycin resistance protein VanW
MVIEPGQTFSWHREVGPPLRWRGFQDGPEMHDGRMTTGRGGGICQVANMFFWLGLHAGLVVVERHRHGFDLFPDEERTVPFGCGATVFFPTLDLKMANTDQLPVLFRLWIEAGGLHGEVRFPSQPSERWSIVEEGHRFFSQEGTLFRENEIFRVVDDGSTAQRELLAKNRAVVCYTVDGQKKTQ